jgi:hypothetical protein
MKSYLVGIKEQVDKKGSTIDTNMKADCLLTNTTTKHKIICCQLKTRAY